MDTNKKEYGVEVEVTDILLESQVNSLRASTGLSKLTIGLFAMGLFLVVTVAVGFIVGAMAATITHSSLVGWIVGACVSIAFFVKFATIRVSPPKSA